MKMILASAALVFLACEINADGGPPHSRPNFDYFLGKECDQNGQIGACYKQAHEAAVVCVRMLMANPRKMGECRGLQSSNFQEWWPLSMKWHENVIGCVCPDCISNRVKRQSSDNENYRQCFQRVKQQELNEKCNQMARQSCPKFASCENQFASDRSAIKRLTEQSQQQQSEFDKCMGI